MPLFSLLILRTVSLSVSVSLSLSLYPSYLSHCFCFLRFIHESISLSLKTWSSGAEGLFLDRNLGGGEWRELRKWHKQKQRTQKDYVFVLCEFTVVLCVSLTFWVGLGKWVFQISLFRQTIIWMRVKIDGRAKRGRLVPMTCFLFLCFWVYFLCFVFLFFFSFVFFFLSPFLFLFFYLFLFCILLFFSFSLFLYLVWFEQRFNTFILWFRICLLELLTDQTVGGRR